jgi:hypothetical protein
VRSDSMAAWMSIIFSTYEDRPQRNRDTENGMRTTERTGHRGHRERHRGHRERRDNGNGRMEITQRASTEEGRHRERTTANGIDEGIRHGGVVGTRDLRAAAGHRDHAALRRRCRSCPRCRSLCSTLFNPSHPSSAYAPVVSLPFSVSSVSSVSRSFSVSLFLFSVSLCLCGLSS